MIKEEGTNIPFRLVDTAAAYSVNVVQSIALRHFRGRGWPAVLSQVIDSTEMKENVLTPGDSLKDGSECYTSHMILMVSCTLLLPSVYVVEVWKVKYE